MTQKGHTKEPWKIALERLDFVIRDAQGNRLGVFYTEEDATRAALCVNWCERMTNGALRRLLEGELSAFDLASLSTTRLDSALAQIYRVLEEEEV